MKKYIASFFLVACLLPSCISIPYANEGYAVCSHQFLPSQIVALLSGDSSVFLLERDPSAGQVQYVSWVSYDFLSELSVSWRSAGVIVYNKTMDAYFIRVSYIPTISTSGSYKYCSLGTSNGYVLGAHAPSDSTTYNIYNYNQTTITHHSNSASGTTSTPYVSSSWADRRLQEELYKDVDYIDIRSYIEKNIVPGMEALNKNMVSFMGAVVSRLDDAVNQLSSIQSASWASVDVENRLLSSLDDLSSNISGVIVDGAVKVTSSPDPVVAEALTGIQNTLTTISNQITEQFGEYESTYSFPDVSTSGQLAANDKIVSGVLSSAFSSINPGSDILFYSPSSTLTLSKYTIYTGSGICFEVACEPCHDSTYGLGYLLSFGFRFTTSQSTERIESVQFPQVSFTDYSGKTFILYDSTGFVRVPAYSTIAWSYSYYFPRWDASGNWLGWSGRNDGFEYTSLSREPSKRVYLAPPESGTYYIYGTSDTAIPVVYASRFSGFLQSQTDRVVNALGSIPAPTDYTSQLTAVTDKLDALANKPAVDLAAIESTLSTISDKLDNTASDVNNTIINITNDNDYFSVFYITDGDGNTQSVTDFAGALTGASGKLLSLLYRLVFADALGSVDGDLGNMEDFFTSEEPPPVTAAMGGDTAPANEVIDVWAS